MVYHFPKTIFYLFFLFIGLFNPCWAKKGGFKEATRLQKEMNFLKMYAEPYIFLQKKEEEEEIDSISTKQAAIKKTDKKVDADAILQALEEETGAFKPSPPNYSN
ncbi:MAG: hypothetical protein DRQ88_00160 [Epsilonproteobacteria bacterium]|nr:MAG: hypothetical protein DRQ89_06085 [Campylobacterota bacterium]RLA68049.1 MAG: hypothetical protein DRQ88_00160 [Campylobacterota bacterium]